MTSHDPCKDADMAERTAQLVMIADPYGPSRCLGHLASLNVLPKRFVCERRADGNVVIDLEFEGTEDDARIRRALAKLSVMPVTISGVFSDAGEIHCLEGNQ